MHISEVKVGEVVSVDGVLVRVLGPDRTNDIFEKFAAMLKGNAPAESAVSEPEGSHDDQDEIDPYGNVRNLVGEIVRHKELDSDHLVGAYKVSESMGPMLFVTCEGWLTLESLAESYYLFDDEGNAVSIEAGE